MQALFAKAPFQIEIRELPMPRPGPGEVLVKVHACGLCGTDLHFVRDWAGDPMPLGHEIAAEVVEPGPGVTAYRPGERVIVEDVGMCGVCENCKNGRYDRCRNNYNLNGQPGMAEYMAVNEHLLNRFEGLDYVQASLVEPLAVAINAVLHAEIPLGGDVVVYGPGPIGLMCVRLAVCKGRAGWFWSAIARTSHAKRLAWPRADAWAPASWCMRAIRMQWGAAARTPARGC